MISKLAKTWYEKTHCTSPWETALFKDVYNMTNDARGAFGEQLISGTIHALGWEIQCDVTNKNVHDDGHYDIKANNHRMEVKTSCLSNSYQHEPLYKENVCDYVIFIDFYYDKFYVSVVKNEELPLDKDNKTLFGRKHGTLRRNKDDGYKLDFSPATIQQLTKAKRCKVFYDDTTVEDIATFLKELIV